MKRNIIVFAAFMVLSIFTAFSSCINREPENSVRAIYCSVVDSLRVRSKPSFDTTSPVIASLYRGETVLFYGEYGSEKVESTIRGKKVTAPFMLIETMEGKKGWVFSAGLTEGKVSGPSDLAIKGLKGKVKKVICYPFDGNRFIMNCEIYYDHLGRKIKETYFDDVGPLKKKTILIRYDEHGRKISNGDYLYTYNKAGFFIKAVVNPDAESSGHYAGCQTVEEEYEYDINGLLKSERYFACATETQIEYLRDKTGEVAQKIVETASDVCGGEKEIITYTRDEKGTIIGAQWKYRSMPCGTDSGTYQFTYDREGNPVAIAKSGEKFFIRYKYEYYK